MKQDPALDPTSVDSLRSWLIDWLAREMEIDRSRIDLGQAFLSYGMDSMKAMMMVGDLEAMLGLRLPPTLAWDYPDIHSLSAHLADRLTDVPSSLPPAVSSAATPGQIERLVAELDMLGDRDVDSLLNPCTNSAF
jgi:acyl carrier protein